ncbi:hypothetical protein CVT26_015350 [Gymnopilus dilepis]|uniref:F-box domain-containing protein n=1 Tax=Gymnopilus dilepis TaxID=231916 RepID=A0A409W4A4_9AGAR|nr:hypothetical protein CVT26_015350 [Gymnopilus dilepis]
MTRRQSYLPEIPAELLFIIFQHLESEDLTNVAQCCRRLNLTTVPVVMAKAGFPNPEKIYVVKLGRKGHSDELTPLVIDITLTAMEKFYCVLSDKRHWHDHDTPDSQIADFTRNIRRVIQLMSRLSSIGSMTLVIASWGSPWFFGREVAQPFTDAVLDLVKVSIEKSCTAFQILHSHPATHPASVGKPYKFEAINGVQVQKLGRSLTRRLFPSLSSGNVDFEGDGWRYRKLRSPTATPSAMPVQGNLTSLDISCEFLLAPPFSTWTFGLMKSSPITRLTLSVPYFVAQEEFKLYLLPHLIAAVPSLQELRFASSKIYILTALVEKLQSFASLEKLAFALLSSTGPYSATPIEPMAEAGLSRLLSFTGSARQAAYLFQRSAFYPNLQFVNIIVDYSDKPERADLARNFATLNAIFSSRCISPCISVCLTNHGPRLRAWSSNIERQDHLQARHLSSVSRLTLDLPRFPAETNEEFSKQINTTLAWMDMFWGLKHVTILLVDSASIEVRRMRMVDAVNAEFNDVEVSISVVKPSLSSTPDNRSHYHWSNARDSWVRGTREIPSMPFFLPSAADNYACSHF